MTAVLRSLAVACAIGVLTTSSAVTVTVDGSVRHQLIRGIGGVARRATANQITNLIAAGVSTIRYDWCDCVDNVADSRPIMNAGIKMVIGSCWSPPASMKDNNSTLNGGGLIPAQYSAFADFAVQKVQSFKQQTGFDLYAICLQNEPSFAEFYCSCVYTSPQLVTLYRTVGKRFKELGIRTKLIFNDDMYGTLGFNAAVRLLLADTLKGDTSAAQYVSALSFHGLSSDGVTPVSLSAQGLQAYATSARRGKMELWMTEGGIDEGIGYGRGIIGAFRYGVNLWTKYDIVGPAGSTNTSYFMCGDVKNLIYYTASCIMKFVKPGMRVIRSASSDTAAFTCFFAAHDSATGALAVCLGTDANTQTITLAGAGLPASFQKWVANASTNCVNQGTVSPGTPVTIPPNTIVTLYAQSGYTPPAVRVVDRRQPDGPFVAAPAAGHTQAYGLQGRLVLPHSTAASVALLRGAAGRIRVVVRR